MSSQKNTRDESIDVLIVEDDENTVIALTRVAEGAGYTVSSSKNLSDVMEIVRTCQPRIVLLDLSLPDGDGIQLITEMKLAGVGEVIVVSGSKDAARTRECLKAGVFDFIQKPASVQDIVRAIRRADGVWRLKERKSAPYPARLRPGFGSLAGTSTASRDMVKTLADIAGSRKFSALITGQSGVLKVDVAALLHQDSARSGHALVVNCSSENDDQAQRRFFGHKETSESKLEPTSSASYLASAQGGTLVLDDVSALPLVIQKQMAVFIERGEVLLEHTLTPTQFDCNIVGVLREPIDTALNAERMHEPLFYQLSKNTIVVPPLVERREDIKIFAQKAVSQLNEAYAIEKSLSLEFVEQLSTYYWPGNLIELKNVLFAAYQATEDGDEIKPGKTWMNSTRTQVPDQIKNLVGQSFFNVEKQLIEATLADNANNKSKTAKILGISLKTLYNRLNTYIETSQVLDID